MKLVLTTTAVLLLGDFIPTAQSQDMSLLEVGFFSGTSIDDDYDGVVDTHRLLSRRAEFTLSQQCIDDFDEIDVDPRHTAIFGTLLETCPAQMTNGTDGVPSINNNVTGCDLSELRDFCDANYQTYELGDLTANCTLTRYNNATDELETKTFRYYSYGDMIACAPKSCPIDWSIEDHEFLMGMGLRGANCTIVEMIDDPGVEEVSSSTDAVSNSQPPQAFSSGTKLTIFFTVAMTCVAAVAMSL